MIKQYKRPKIEIIEEDINKKKSNIDSNYEIYPNINNESFLSELYNKTEFIINEHNENFTYENELDIDDFLLKSHQLFVKNYMSIHTPYRKLFLMHATGSGKTLAAWGITQSFIEEFKKYPKNEDTPKIYIVGYTEQIFKRQLISRPYFGFIDEEETNYLIDVRNKFGVESKEYIIERARIYQRLSDRSYNGYYKFYGYQEIFNRIFKIVDSSVEANFNMEELLKYINDGKIEVNTELLNCFENSLLICDEIHNLYNSDEGNKSGLCIRYITNTIKNLKSIYMSATPIKNDPRELVDLINLLSNQMNDIISNDDFQKILNSVDNQQLIEKFIKENLKGKVSSYEDVDLRYFPERIIVGEKIKGISLLKFIRCYMSSYYFNNYIKLVNYDNDNNNITFKQSDRIYEDIILPECINDDKLIAKETEQYKNKYEIDYDAETERSFGELYYINNLKKYSPKYHEMLIKLDESIGKVFIYHDYIRKGGVNMIASILSENGYIEHNDNPHSNTKCSICKKILKNHTHTNHEFMALRYILYTGEKTRNIQDELIKLFEFNNPDGYNYKVIIGSSALRESKDLKEVNNCFIMTLPINISTLIQVIGRCIRRNSHITLPIDRQYVNICIFIHSMTDEQKKEFKTRFDIYDTNDVYSLEENQYKKKTETHMEIQFIEKIIKDVAIDNILYPNNVYNDDFSFKFNEKTQPKIVINYKNLDYFSFIHHDYVADSINFTIKYIQALLKDYKILHINDILEFFYQHDYIINYNTRLINKNYILYILNKILLYNSIERRGFINNYTIGNDKFIIRVDNYIILLDDNINNIYNDIFNRQKKNKTINMFNYIDNVDDDLKSIYKRLETKVVDFNSFFNLFNDIIPAYILKKELEHSNNKLIKKIMDNNKKKKFNITHQEDLLILV